MNLKLTQGLRFLYGVLGALTFLIAFNNCGMGFVAKPFDEGSAIMFSRAPGETCEAALIKVYQNTYHPFLSQNCKACHINGPGIGSFASSDLAKSYESFLNIGSEKISNQALNDNHKPPYTGVHHTTRINELRSYWSAAQTDYTSCVSAEGEAPINPFAVKTTSSSVPGNLAVTFVRMEWDLETQSATKLPLVAGIEIRKSVLNGVTQGYDFRNPTLRLKNTTSGNYQARALSIYINNQLQNEITTYSNVDLTISTITDLNLSPGTAYALAVGTPESGDTIALEFSSLNAVSPTPTPTPPGSITYTQLAASGGIFANSCFACHSSANPGGGLDMTNYAATKAAALNIKNRINNATNPMPTGGLLPQTQRDSINAWVDQGAPQ